MVKIRGRSFFEIIDHDWMDANVAKETV